MESPEDNRTHRSVSSDLFNGPRFSDPPGAIGKKKWAGNSQRAQKGQRGPGMPLITLFSVSHAVSKFPGITPIFMSKLPIFLFSPVDD